MKDLNVNKNISVLIKDDIYKSNIQDITKDYIAISVPVKDGIYNALSENQIVEIIYIDKGAAFKFTTKVLGRKIENIPMILVSMPEEKDIIRIQRRNFVRIPLLKSIKYRIINENIKNKNFIDNKDLKEAKLMDLSGSGMKIKIEEDINLNDKIVGTIKLEDKEVIVTGKVVRKYKENDSNVCGINFIDLHQRIIDDIVKYIFEVMRKRRKNGIREV